MPKNDIRLASFNLLNLNKPGLAIYDKKNGWTEEEYKAKIGFSARMLLQIDADVIGFQECWGADVLEDVFIAAGLNDRYDLFARTLAPRSIQVALAVRKGLARSAPLWIEEFPDDARFTNMLEARDATESISVTIRKFSRPPLRLDINVGAGTPDITMFVCHLKSKGPTKLKPDADNPVLKHNYGVAQQVASHVRRMVEAGAMRILLDKEMKGNDKPFIVMGDLNDSTTSVSTELLSGKPGYRFFAKSKSGTKSDAGLYTGEKLQQLRSYRNVYYTHIFENGMESLDHILVSDAFYDNALARKWSFREMKVFNDHLTASDGERQIHGYNDHGVIVAHFDWNPIKADIAAEAKSAGKQG